MIKAVIFDVDGVLVDSRDSNVDFFQKLLPKVGYSKPSREEVLKHFHLPLKEALAEIIDTTDNAELLRIMTIGNEKVVRDTALLKFPESLEQILKELKKKYLIGIVTSRNQAGLDVVFSIKDIKSLFDVVVVREHYQNRKPHPEPLFVASDRLHINPDEAIYIGDSNIDIEAAKAAGMSSIHFSPYVHKNANVGISNFDQIPEAVNRIAKLNSNHRANN